MTKKNPNYLNGCVYIIFKRIDGFTHYYIGSTCNYNKRMIDHKAQSGNSKVGLPIDRFIKNNGGWNTWTRSVCAYHPCENRQELRIKEQHHIDRYSDRDRYPEYIPLNQIRAIASSSSDS